MKIWFKNDIYCHYNNGQFIYIIDVEKCNYKEWEGYDIYLLIIDPKIPDTTNEEEDDHYYDN